MVRMVAFPSEAGRCATKAHLERVTDVIDQLEPYADDLFQAQV